MLRCMHLLGDLTCIRERSTKNCIVSISSMKCLPLSRA